MEHTARPLTKRPRAPIACNACRQAKSKCDGAAPACGRCVTLKTACAYSHSGRDRRMDRQAERKANSDLRNRVRELESRLAASPHPQQPNSAGHASTGSPPVRPGSQDSTGSGPAHPNAESPVDVLAAGVFDHPSSGYICYFGSSANHALFWSLTASIANLGHRSSRLYQEPLRPRPGNGVAPRLPQPPSSSCFSKDSDEGLSPSRDVAARWITRFFDTVGAILPYISEPVLLEGIDKIEGSTGHSQPSTRSMQALLNIVFAHSLSTLDDRSPEPFYRRTLGLLDPRTLYVSSLELLQTLMLLSIYQQNSQRSTESWTSHSLAVKTSYQLGIHSPSSYDYVGVHDKELRSRLWFAVVNQDRMLSSALGQPCLVPLQHVRMDITDMLVTVRQNRTVEMSYPGANLSYFRNIIGLHDIMGAALDIIYGSNISSSNRLSLQDLVSKTLELSLRLGQWRNNNVPSGILTTNVDFSTWPASAFEAERHRILISVFYYRTMILVHGSLLMATLGLATNGSQELSPGILQETVRALLRDDFTAVTEMQHLIRGILRYNRSFLKCNAIWWTCNYAALTTSLHLFGFWVASHSDNARFMTLGMESSQLEVQLRDCLDTLKAIGVASAMSVKAHRCLLRHLHFLAAKLSTTTSDARPSDPLAPGMGSDFRGSQNVSGEGFDQEGSASLVSNPAAELFGDLSVQDLMGGDLLGLELGVSDFDATGLI